MASRFAALLCSFTQSFKYNIKLQEITFPIAKENKLEGEKLDAEKRFSCSNQDLIGCKQLSSNLISKCTQQSSIDCISNQTAVQARTLQIASETIAKVDLLATGGLIALAIALNLAYLNLTTLRFPEKLKRFIDKKLLNSSSVVQLGKLIQSNSSDEDRSIGSMIYKMATPSKNLEELGIKNNDFRPCGPSDIADEDVSAQLFYRFAFAGNEELSPVPTWDKVICAICGVVAVSYLFRDTAAMMGVKIHDAVWAVAVMIPIVFVTLPMRKFSRTAVSIISISSLTFLYHLFQFSESSLYLGSKNLIDFSILTACVLIPTLIVVWSNSAYPWIETKIGKKLSPQAPAQQ